MGLPAIAELHRRDVLARTSRRQAPAGFRLVHEPCDEAITNMRHTRLVTR